VPRPIYTEIEHTADVGMEVEAPDVESAFALAAASMFDLICDLDSVGEDWQRRVVVHGREDDLGYLLVRWLCELLYVFESERVLLSDFRILHMTPDGIEARVVGERYDSEKHALKVELKAATYHGLVIEQHDGQWFIRVIFDT
jgi:SHS2 domain-containing protein